MSLAARHGGPSGLRQFGGLYAEAFRLIRGSAGLRRSLSVWLGIGLVSVEAYSLLVANLHDRGTMPLIGLGAVAWWGAVAMIVVGGTPLLITPDGRRIHHYGVPNGLTALRAWASYPLLLCATLSMPHHLGFILWCTVGFASGMLDYVDGVIARRIGPITALGKAMDPASDSLFFMMAAIGNVFLGILPLWLAGLILVRFAGPLLATPIVFLLRRRPELTHTRWGRWNTGATGCVIFILMWVRIFNGPVDPVAVILAVPTLVPSTIAHFHQLWVRARQAPVLSE
ncbi:MAG: CDP-alcohol phosphatidyltransferase family protein [Candidatus Dormibacteria bacterium]